MPCLFGSNIYSMHHSQSTSLKLERRQRVFSLPRNKFRSAHISGTFATGLFSHGRLVEGETGSAQDGRMVAITPLSSQQNQGIRRTIKETE